MSNEQIENIVNDSDKYKDYLLKLMIDNNSSDMYLTLDEKPSLRIDNHIYRIQQLPEFGYDQLQEIAYMFLSDEEWETFRETLTYDLGWSYEWRRFRINISKQQKSIMIVVRLLWEKVPTIDDMWLPQVFKEFVNKSSGIVLVAWPTWSGKSTTLASMIEEVNQNHSKHIITIEDPVEYVFNPKKSIIEQKQLWTDVLSFSWALKSALRQRPDVILFGEMRDLESIQNAITLAETGHLVISTIHSKSSAQTITKIIDSFSSDQQNQVRLQLSETLLSVISQRLLKKKDKKWVVACHEIMINDTAISNLIRENQINQINNIIQTSTWSWMKLLEESLIELIEKWEVSIDDALAIANKPDYIKNEIESRWMILE